MSEQSAPLNDDDNNDGLATQRERIEAFAAAQRVAEEAQDEEILRLALELSVSESNSDRHLHHETSEHSGNSNSIVWTAPVRHAALGTSPTVTAPPLRSVLRQRLHETSTRSLEEMILQQRGPPPSRSVSGGVARTVSERLLDPDAASSQQHDLADSLRLDWTDDDDDDDDDDFLEDLDPDDAPELRRVRPSPSSASHAALPAQSESSRRKSHVPPTDLDAAAERFRSSVVVGSRMDPPPAMTNARSTARPGLRRPRPGLVVRVDAPAPKVKPPGRHRTAVALRSPAIDPPKMDPASGTSSSSSGAAVAGTATAVQGPPRTTKPPAVRSAIVSHITGGSRRGGGGGSESSLLGPRTAVSARSSSNTAVGEPPERSDIFDMNDQEEKEGPTNAPWNAPSPLSHGAHSFASGSCRSYGNQEDWPTPSEQREWSTAKPPRPSDVDVDRSMDLTEKEMRDLEQALRASQVASDLPATTEYDLTGASAFLSTEELMNIQEALNTVTPPPESMVASGDDIRKPAAVVPPSSSFPEDEAEAIARALREADEEEERRSLELALRMQQEEARQFTASVAGGGALRGGGGQPQGNVRSMTRAEYEAQQYPSAYSDDRFLPHQGGMRDDVEDEEDRLVVDGYRMNSMAQQNWSRRDHSSIVGPNQEIRTKHDTTLQSEANAHRLGLLAEETPNLSNQAYNSFLHSVKATKKGVATKGTGRAGSDADATKGGAMDAKVRQHIHRAINSEIIEKCNGVVKEGKEAIVYHADKGAESGGFDVAIKVFKKIQEFRNRGYYVDGDPRYGNNSFRNLNSNDQLELWAEKEFRNLTRASRAGVPVPIPLHHKENIVFMRFLGEDGWPAPQLRELNLQHGSQRWYTLFSQVMEAIKQYV